MNTGSSSVKTAVFDSATMRRDTPVADHAHSPDQPLADVLGKVIREAAPVDAVVHRVVHGGDKLRAAVRITPEVQAEIERCVELAPLHNPVALAGIAVAREALGAEVPEVAVFDTAFHATLPPEAYTYGGPRSWLGRGMRRYGFHGVSHAYATRRAAELAGSLPGKLVTCHLGSGCSLAAVQAGASVDTTMGFTPLDGIVMETRSGAVDPGLLLFLLRDASCTQDKLEHVLNFDSGLKGLSGLSGDMREILAARAGGNADAALAFNVWLHRLCGGIAAMSASLRGLDALAFTGGVGENSAVVRGAACERLAFLGVQLDPGLNASTKKEDRELSRAGSAVRAFVIHTREEWEMARECSALLRAPQT